MLVFLVVTILILSLSAAQIRVGLNFYLNLFGNDGFIKIYLFGIRVFHAAVHFEHDEEKRNNLVIEHGKKSGKIHLNTDVKDKKSIAAMLKNPAFENMLVEKVSAHFTAGRTNDSFFTIALLQSMRVLFYSFMAPVKCRYSVDITESFTPVYNRDVLQTDFIGIIGISIADIIVSCIKSIFKQTNNTRKQEVART
ncbi:MAG: hypothetical protein HFE35_04140 [Clostridia bacterium]|jgi:hypothetical protein|uniref:hypothetical protein n=1 Tax=Pumilibacter muris TaxID=2941510 RepID=UPI00203C264B|nr:hypothetical protein [Pumilibacter muris]MCI8595994.1 hypothetical protein [Clostridia bacterium]